MLGQPSTTQKIKQTNIRSGRSYFHKRWRLPVALSSSKMFQVRIFTPDFFSGIFANIRLRTPRQWFEPCQTLLVIDKMGETLKCIIKLV